MTGRNGDAGAVGQGQHQVGFRGIVDRGGIGNAAAFTDFSRGRQGDGSGIYGVIDRRVDAVAEIQIFIVAAFSSGDINREGFTVLIDIISRRINGDRAFGLTGRNGDAGAVGQGQHQVGFRGIVDRGGIGNLAAFTHFSRGRQGDGSGIYGVIDRRVDAVAEIQIFIVAAFSSGDIDREGFTVLIDIISRRINGDSAFGLTGRNGDAGAVGQGQHQVGFRGIVDRGGIGDLAAFTHFSRGRQGDGGGIYGVIDLGVDTVAEIQLFIVAAFSSGDIDREGFTVLIDIISRCRDGDSAFGLTGRNGDAGAVGQGQHQVGFRGIVDRGGIGNLAAFTHFSRSCQGDGSGIYGVIDRRVDTVAEIQIFIVAGFSSGDIDREGFTVLIDIIRRCRDGDCAFGLTGRNGDAGAGGQGQHQVGFRGIVDRGGIGNLAAFTHFSRSCQGDGSGIYGVIDRRVDTVAEIQIFIVAGFSSGDIDREGFTVLIDIIRRCRDGDCAFGLTGRNGDAGAGGQGQHQVGFRGIVDRGGIGNLAAFTHFSRSCQGDGSGIYGVIDRRVDTVAEIQIFIVAGFSSGDIDREGFTVLIDIIRRCRDGDCAFGLTGRNGDAGAGGQGQHQVGFRGIVDRGGIGNLAAFTHFSRSCQGDGSGIYGVIDRRVDTVAEIQIFIVAGFSSGDIDREGFTVLIDIIRRCRDGDCAFGLTGRNGDAGAGGQGQHQVGFRGIVDRGGIGNLAAFTHFSRSCQGDGSGIYGVIDRRVDTVAEIQIFIVAGFSSGDIDREGFTVLIDIIRRCRDGDCAFGLTGRNGDAGAGGQGQHQVGFRGIVDRGGIGNLAAFTHFSRSCQGDGSGIYGVIDRRVDTVAEIQIFIVAGFSSGDIDREGFTVLIDIIRRCRDGDCAFGLTGRNGDAGAGGQGQHQVGFRGIVDRGGIGNLAAFTHFSRSCQGDGSGIYGVIDRRVDTVAEIQIFIVAGFSSGDIDREGFTVLIDIIRRCRDGDCAFGLTGRNGDAGAGGQGQHQVGFRGIVDRGGIGNLAAFTHFSRSCQGDGSGIYGVIDRRVDTVAEIQIFIVAGFSSGDIDREGFTVLIDIIRRCRDGDCAFGLTGRNGDAGAGGQGQHQVGFRGIVDRGGIGNLAAFTHFSRSCQGDGSGIYGVIDRRVDTVAEIQIFIVAGFSSGDIDREGFTVLIDIIRRCRDGDCAFGLTGRNGDAGAGGQGQHQVGFRGIVDRGGIGNLAAFTHFSRSCQGDGSGIYGVIDRRVDTVAEIQIFIVAGFSSGDIDREGFTVLIDIIRRCRDGDCAFGLTGRNGDAGAGGQGQHQVGFRGIVDRGGIGNLAAFTHFSRSCQGDGSGIYGVIDRRVDTVAEIQIFIVAGFSSGDIDREGFTVLIDIIRRCRDGDCAFGLTGRNGDAGAGGQGQHQVGFRGIVDRGGIGNLAAFTHFSRSCQGDGSGIYGVIDRRVDTVAEIQIFIVAGFSSGDIDREGFTVLIDIIRRCRDGDCAFGLTGRNGDAGAGGQGQHQVGFRGIVDRGGIGNLAAFTHFSRSCQGDGSGIYGVIDRRVDTVAEIQIFIVAGFSSGDIDREGFTVLIDIIRRCRDGDCAFGLTGRNGDAGAGGQGQHQVGFRGIVDRGGIGNLAAFTHFSRSCQGDGSGIYGVIDRRVDAVAEIQIFIVAAFSSGDINREGFTVLIDIIRRRRDGDSAFGLTRWDYYSRAVGQGQHQVIFKRGIIYNSCVGDTATLIDLGWRQ